MIQRDLSWVAKATAGELVGSPIMIRGVSTDSRTVGEGNLFIPIIGDTFDGHQFVSGAMARGAVAFLWKKGLPIPDELKEVPHVVVGDTLHALQNMASSYRHELPMKVVGVTGSNGKTTTKEMMALILSARYRTYRSPGNLNNHIGLPLSLLQIPEDTEVAVFEMGMNHAGEIARLAEIAKPDVGVITMIGEAHIGYLGSRAAIAKAKWELIDALPSGGAAFIPSEEPLLQELTLPVGVDVFYFGENAGADARLVRYEASPPSGALMDVMMGEKLGGATAHTNLPFPGKHLALDALAACSVAMWFGIRAEEALRALSAYQMDAMRLAVMQLGDRLYLINDAYNAAPSSIEGALKVMGDLEVDVRIAVLGDMLELGEHAKELHRKVGTMVGEYGIQELIAVGDMAHWYLEGASDRLENLHTYEAAEAEDATNHLMSRLIHHLKQEKTCAVLVKGSRKIGLEKVAKVILADFPGHEQNSH